MPKKTKARQASGKGRSTDAQLQLGTDKLYFKIGEVAEIVGVAPYVLRYWETEFKAVRPQKSRSQQRVYRRRDVATLLRIKHLLYEQRFTIAGARQQLKEEGTEGELAAPSGVYLARQSLAQVRALLTDAQRFAASEEGLDRAAADPAGYLLNEGGALTHIGRSEAGSLVARPKRDERAP